jgi:uncharacterized membrane protein YphA (DoxX/SURF4 family)
MKTLAKQFFFGTTLSSNKATNIIWLLFRLHIGLTIALKAGLPKMQEGLAPEWFVKQVGEIGFTFISPTFWATLASWGEFIGGICIAFGLLTRFNAIQLAFQFFVIAFIWYDKPEPITGMYFQNTLFMCYLLTAFLGGGIFSLDYIINKKLKNITVSNVKTVVSALVMLFVSLSSIAQKGPLRGSGKVILKTYDYNNFTAIKIKDIADAKVYITVGKPYKITTKVDDNLSSNFEVAEIDNTLSIKIKNNKENKLYIEDTKIEVEIEMPELNNFFHSSNSNIIINGLNNAALQLKNSGNGNVTLIGKTTKLHVTCSSNGNINATQLIVDEADATARGNGNIYLNANNISKGNRSGNGNIINSNKLYTDKTEPIKPEIVNNKVKLTIINKTNKLLKYKVQYPIKGSYGIDIEEESSSVEFFPIGTKLYKNKRLQYTVTKEKEQVFEIK